MTQSYKDKIIEKAIDDLKARLIRRLSGGERRNEKRQAFEKACQDARSADRKGE